MVKSSPNYWERAWCNEKKSLSSIFKIDKRTKAVLDLLRKFINKKGISLEAGCGYGRIVFLLGKEGYPVVGLDFSVNLIQENIEKLEEFKKQREKVDIKFKLGDVRNLPFPDNYFMNYISLGVIEHFKKSDQKKILNEAYRVLDKRGIIFISVPNKYSIWTIFLWIYSRLNPKKWVYQKNMSKKKIESITKLAGFKKKLCFNKDVYGSFRRSFNLEFKQVKGLPNPFYYSKKLFIVFSRLLERYLYTIGIQTYYIGLKKKDKDMDN